MHKFQRLQAIEFQSEGEVWKLVYDCVLWRQALGVLINWGNDPDLALTPDEALRLATKVVHAVPFELLFLFPDHAKQSEAYDIRAQQIFDILLVVATRLGVPVDLFGPG